MKNEKKEMGVVSGMVDSENVVGFVKVKNFDGISIHINPQYLKKLLEMIAILDELDDIEVGISNTGLGGRFFIFTDKKREAAIGVAGRMEKEE